MICKELFKIIDQSEAKYLDILEDVCNIESPTSFKEGIDKVGQYFVNLAEKRGWKIEIEKQEKAGLKFKEILNDVIEFENGVILKEFQLVNSEGDLLYSSDFKKKYFQSHYYLCSLWFCMVSA